MSVYLDHHATTPVDPRVLDAMLPYFREEFGNASSTTHAYGRRAQEAVDRARHQVAEFLGGSAREIVFTSGATEANNLAILGAARCANAKRRHIVTQVTEHHAVLDPVRELVRTGFEATEVAPDGEGRIAAETIGRALRDDTFLVSVMLAQNEVGTIEPLAEIASLARAAGALVHTDAAQAAGKIPIDVRALGVDLLSLSGHKFYAPKGVGALWIRRRGEPRVRVAAVTFGGGQESKLRPGTLNVPGIVGLGEACRIVSLEIAEEMARIAALRDRLWAALRTGVPDIHLNGPPEFDARVPGNLSVSFPRIDGTALLLELRDVAASSGSACTSGNAEPSYVLKAMGLPDALASSTLRFCVGRFQTEDEIDIAARDVIRAVETLRTPARRR